MQALHKTLVAVRSVGADLAALSISKLSVRFGARTILESINLSVRQGEFVCIVGSSGSGKTTLLRAVGGFVRPASGTIALDGTDFSGVPPHRRPVNTVFQSGALFPHLSVAANIGFGPRQRGIPRTICRVGMAHQYL